MARRVEKAEIVILRPGVAVPEYKTEGSAGFDLINASGQDITLLPEQIVVVPTGLKIKFPEGLMGLVTPRSGKSISGFSVNNSPGIIDDDFRDEMGVIAINNGRELVTLKAGERIAQFVCVPYIHLNLEVVDELSPDEFNNREGGMGSTGSH